MERMRPLILGLVPFPVGRVMDWMLVTASVRLPLGLIGIGMLVLWCFIAYWCYGRVGRTVKTVFWLNLPALAVLVLLGVQTLVFHAYWGNLAGAWTQLFYLPLLTLGFTLTAWSDTMFPVYCAGFLLLAAAAVLGCRIKKGRTG